MRKGYILLMLLLILCSPVYAEIKATDMGQFAYDSLVFAISSLSSDEFINLPSATQSLIQNAPFLALKIIENEGGSKSNQLLAKAIALRLDAALAEEYDCAVLKRGKGILPSMKKYRTTLIDVIQSCEKDARRLNVDPSSICAGQSAIEHHTDDLILALEKGRRCQ